MVAARLEKVVDGDPLRRGYFRAENEGGTRGEEEGERTNRDGWENRSSGYHVIEAAEELLRGEFDPDLFTCFPDDCGKEIRIPRLAPTAWQRHVPRPGIAQAVGTSNQKDCIWVGRDDDGHCGPYQCGIVSGGRMAVGQTLLEAGEPAGQCE